METNDALWSLFKPIIDAHYMSRGKVGRPRKADRPIFDGVIWLNRSGARWQDLPRTYGSPQTAHRRYQEWVSAGLIDKLYEMTIALAVERGLIKDTECYIDATFAAAKKGGPGRGHKKGKRQ
jgi:transposase